MFKLHDTKMDTHLVMDIGRDTDINTDMADMETDMAMTGSWIRTMDMDIPAVEIW